jgi:hypothetical protein
MVVVDNYNGILCKPRKHTHLSAGLTEPSQHANTSYRTQSTSYNEKKTDNKSSNKKTMLNLRMLKLTEAERTLLNNNEGCTKCRMFFTDHCAFDCTNDWPQATNYCTLTQQDADMARCRKRIKPTPIAVTLPNNATASVMPERLMSEQEGDSMESDEVSETLPTIPTNTVPMGQHLIWCCAVDNRNSEFLKPCNVVGHVGCVGLNPKFARGCLISSPNVQEVIVSKGEDA